MISRIATILMFCLSVTSVVEAGDSKISNQEFFNQFKEVFERVDRDYVQEPDKQEMVDAAINGMLTSLDPHSGYYTDEDLDDFINQTKGEFGGIGVEVIPDNGVVKVISPIDDLPAHRAGIKAGDYIIGVNDDLVSNLGFNKAVREMRGEPGTKVNLLVINDEETKPRKIEITREIVKIKPVKANLEKGGVAYVRIVTFNENTISELKKAFKQLDTESKDSGGIKGIILDLRNNPGGLLDQAVAVSEYFIDSGVVVTTKGRTGSSTSTLTASKFSAKAMNVPMIILINSGSASASEIVAGALQDHKRALVIGTKSFGKGSVQTFMRINQRAAVKITTAKYYTPSGRSIQAEGIEPDITIETAKVEFTDKKDEFKRFSESSLKNYLKNDKGDATGKEATPQQTKPADNESMKATNKKEEKGKPSKDDKKTTKKDAKNDEDEPSELYKKDYQFARAYDLVRALILSKQKQN
jgi:carboxyl-terminal processing protease